MADRLIRILEGYQYTALLQIARFHDIPTEDLTGRGLDKPALINALSKQLFTPEHVSRTLQNIGHGKWRDYDAEDSVRFYALRMKETGMIASSPQEIIAKGTDWQFLDELKRELKT